MIYLGRIYKYHSWIKHFLQQKINRINKIIEKKTVFKMLPPLFSNKSKANFL